MPQKLITQNAALTTAEQMKYGELGEVIGSAAYNGCIVAKAYNILIVVVGNGHTQAFLTTFDLNFSHNIRLLSSNEIVQLSN